MPRLSQDPAHLAPFIVTPLASTQARRVQTANTSANRPSTSIREVGNDTFVGIAFDPTDTTISVEANLVNARLLSLFANYTPGHLWNDKSLQDMIGYADVDLLMMQRNTAKNAWLQSVYVRQAAVNSYRLAASTTDSATETFDLSASNKTAFEKFVQVDNLVAPSTGHPGYTLTATPITLMRGQLSGNQLISAAFSQPSGATTYMLETTDYTVTGTAVSISNTTITAQIVAGTQFLFAYQKTTPGGDPFQAKDTTSPAAIRGYYHIPITITANSPNGMVAKGVQNIEATMSFNANEEFGMGSQEVGQYRDVPAEVAGNITIFSQNYDAEKLMIGGDAVNPINSDFPIEAFRNDIAFKIEFKHPDTRAVLRVDVLSGLTIVGEGKDVAVGQQVGKQYNIQSAANFTWYVSKLA